MRNVYTYQRPSSSARRGPTVTRRFAPRLLGSDGASLRPPSRDRRYFFAFDAQTRDATVSTAADDGQLEAVINTNHVDRYGTIVDPRGADVSAFLANPVLLWCHGMDSLGNWPIGTVQAMSLSDNEIVARVQFDMENAAAAEIARLYRRRILRGFSIGFIPRSYHLERIGEDDVVRFTSWELAELSACAVPANPHALARALRLSERDMQRYHARLAGIVRSLGKPYGREWFSSAARIHPGGRKSMPAAVEIDHREVMQIASREVARQMSQWRGDLCQAITASVGNGR